MASLGISYPGSSEVRFYRAHEGGNLNFSVRSFDGSKGESFSVKEIDPGDFELAPLKTLPNTDEQLTREAYLPVINKTIEYLKANQLGKIVISRYADEGSLNNPLEAFIELVKAYPDACVYIFSDADLGTWLGATPEVLLKGENGQVSAMSLAGTAAAGNEEELGQKERHEQGMVTDFIVQAFQDSGVSEVKVNGPRIHKAGNLVHLLSEVSASVPEGFDHGNLLQNLHPTPAVAGLPRDEALEFIYEVENYNRELYTGYFGLRQADNYSYFVNLRCMQIFADGVRFYAGGGVTVDSDPESEWLETERKMDTLRNILM